MTMIAQVWSAFASAMHADVEGITLSTDSNGDLWSITEGATPARDAARVVTSWDGEPS